MSYPQGTLVWANFGIWYPAIVNSVNDETGEILIIFSDGTGSYVTAESLEPFENEHEERKNHPDIAPLWDDFMKVVENGVDLTAAAEDEDSASSADEAEETQPVEGETEEAKEARRAARAEKKRLKAEKRAKKKEKEEKKKEKKEKKEKEEKKDKKDKEDKKSKKSKKDEVSADEFAEFINEDDEDYTPVDRTANQTIRGVRRTQIAAGGAQHLEQPVGRIADLQMVLLKQHYNTVLANEVAGGNTRLMPFYEQDYLLAAERAIQRRTRTERFLSLALKKASDEGRIHTPAAKTMAETKETLRNFDLTKAFALPAQDPLERSVPAADAVEVRSIPRGNDTAPGVEKLKHVTTLYYRDSLTSIADGTSLVPVEPIASRSGFRRTLSGAGGFSGGIAANLTAGGNTQLSQGASALLSGRFFSSNRVADAPMALKATSDTAVMTQWRLFRELPPRDDHSDAQYIPPVGALPQRFDEAGQQLWNKAYRRTMKLLGDNDQLILQTTAQTTEARLGLNIGYDDIPAAGGPPAGPEDVEDLAHDRDVISRQLRALGETLERERTLQGKSQFRNEAAQTFLELTQRAGGNVSTQNPTGRPTQFNFYDFGATAAEKREQRDNMGSVEHGSAVQIDSIGSHLVSGSPAMENPLTPVNYGYDLEETYRTDVPLDVNAMDDIRSVKSNDLPSVASLWEKGSIAEGIAPMAGLLPASQRDSGTTAGAAAAAATASATPSGAPIDARKTVREIFLKEAKALTLSLEKLVADALNATANAATGTAANAAAANNATFRSSSGIVVKQSLLNDVLEYLRDVSNIRAIVEKLTVRALEQLQSRIVLRKPTDTSPIITHREAKQLASSFRRQIERAHRLDADGLANLVPSNVSRPQSEAQRSQHSAHSEARSHHSRSTANVSVRSSNVGQRRSRERDYDE